MMTETVQFLILSAALFICAYFCTSKIFRYKDGFSKLLAAFILFFTFVVLILEATGFSNLAPGITIKNVAAGVVFILLALFVIKSGLINSCLSPMTPVYEKLSSWTIATLCVSCFLLIVFTITSLTTPPAPTDAFLDHLVFPAEWLHAGRIFPVQTLSPDQATTYYPSNAELVYLWLILPFHDDLLTGFLEPLCLLLCWLASCRIFTRIGLSRNSAMATAAVSACVPGVIIMTLHSGVDLFFTFAVLSCAAFLLPESDGSRSASEIVVAGLAAGLAIGTKYVGIITVIFLIPLVLAGAKKQLIQTHFRNILLFCIFALISGGFWYFRNYFLTGSPLYPMGVKIGGLFLMKGAFYRDAMFNAYLHISPGDVKYFLNVLLNILFGKWVFIAVLISYISYRIIFNRMPQKLYALIFVFTAILCFVFLNAGFRTGRGGTILLLVCFASSACLLYSSTEGSWWKKYLALIGPLLIFSFWFINPYNTSNNYRFMAPAVFLIAGFIIFPSKKHSTYVSIAVFAVSLMIAAYNFDSVSRCLHIVLEIINPKHTQWHYEAAITGLTAFLLCVFLVIAVAYIISSKEKIAYVFLLLAAMVLPLFLSAKSKNMETGRYKWYSSHYLGAGWNALAVIEEPLTIAYAGNCSPYGLYGNSLKNNVKYINVDGRKNLIFHDYEKELRNTPGYIMPVESVGLNYIFRENTSYENWLTAMRTENIDILYVTKEFYRGVITEPMEMQWAKQNPEEFKLLFNRGDTLAFLVLK